MAEHGPLLGQTLELVIGGPAHGGTCVARYPDPGGRAVFVRHTLPGERVRALVTQDRGGSYCFADAVEVLEAAPGRVERPCPFAGPGQCGGCDWQHACAATQRELKLTVVHEQFDRLAHLDVRELLTAVDELPGGLLGWRTRNLYAVARDGTVGLHRHGSHAVEPVDHCPIGVPAVADTAALARVREVAASRRGVSGVELADGADAGVAVLEHRPGGGRQARGRRPPDRVRVVAGPQRLPQHVLGHDLQVSAGGFWQVHPHAAETFGAALLELVDPQPGETVFDLYAGAGALTVLLAAAVGASGRVLGLESDATAVADAADNLAAFAHAEVGQGRVTAGTVRELADLEMPDVVVLDPPRSGAGRDVMQALLELRPRAVGYVACDPAALARDVAVARAAGWRLTALRAFDAFPMTHHVECVARLEPPPA